MSALRVSRPGYPTELIDLGPAVGRTTHSRLGIKGGSVQGAYVVGRSGKPHSEDHRTTHAKRSIVDLKVRKNPDNGGVQASITEVQR